MSPDDTPRIPEGHTLIVAFSAGADSVLTAHMAALTGKPLILWYLHHYPSPIELPRERVFAGIQEKYPQLTVVKEQVDVARVAQRLGYSWEHTAALLRRKHLVRFRLASQKSTGEKYLVLTGHNYSDYLETIALRRERGLPEDAMPAMSALDEVTGFVRPLHALTREEVRQRVGELGLPYFDDPANEDMGFARNRIRRCQPHTSLPAQQEKPYVDFKTETPREFHLPLADWHKLSKTEKSRAVFCAFRRLMVVRRFTRNHFDSASRLPFSLPPFFAHTEVTATGEVVVFRRGLGENSRIPQAGGEHVLRGDKVSRGITIAMPYGHKSVAKIFSEKKISSRQRRRTLVILNAAGTEAQSIRYPEDL